MKNTVYTTANNTNIYAAEASFEDRFDELFELYGLIYEDDYRFGTISVIADRRYTYVECTL